MVRSRPVRQLRRRRVDGKAKGSGTRTIYTTETATYMAKSRTLPADPIAFEKGSHDLWDRINKPAADEIPA
jgi:hypothetical protein